MRSILVHADARKASEARLQTALALARATGGHVTVLLNTPVQRYVAMDPFGGAYPMTDAINDALARTTDLAARLDAQLSQDDVPFSIETSETEALDGLLTASRLADVVIVGLDRAGDIDGVRLSGIVGALAVTSGPPVLAVPDDTVPDLGSIAMVAWNDSSEAANAVRASVPLLRHASRVEVITIAAASGKDCNPDGVLRYLSRHGVHAQHRVRASDGLTVEEVIEKTATDINADYIVMGAYGHNRMRELLFGGVTRYMIDSGKFPLFMTH